MAKIRTNLADAEIIEAIPKDWYAAHIIEYAYGDSKASIQRGAPEKMFTFTWEVDEGDYSGRKIPFHTVSLSAKAGGLREKFLDDIRFPRTCLSCGNEYTESAKVSKEASKINKAGLACPTCMSQGETEWESGEPAGSAFNAKRAMIGVSQEMSRPQPGSGKEPKLVNRIEDTAPIR